ncbi:hypothetical protein TNCV_848791 [Trichonephila clavipes]|uniref:Uncharacterized protein n=1 Tax=Trichonephila clavipes TaxID=2585209 RepID=A0A8X6RML2_TRICX|nr:hypothetical protein TNCV_848791 [Trichonephila clavipes]
MDPIDAFPEHISTTVVTGTLSDKPDALEYAAPQGQVQAGIIYQEPNAKRLPPPTPIHVPAEKRTLEENSLPFSKKRVRITPVMRRVSRRPELPMAPVHNPHVLEPVQIPLVPQSPVQIPVSQVPQPPVQIAHVPETPVQIPV